MADNATTAATADAQWSDAPAEQPAQGRSGDVKPAQVFSKLGIEGSADQHRRVLAVLTYLRS